MLNAIGLQNKGLEDFLENKVPYFAKIKTPLIVNIAGEAPDDFITLVRALHARQPVVKALELNFSCPNVEAGGAGHMKKCERIVEIMKAVRAETDLVLFAKLSPELGDVVSVAQAVVEAGADGLSLINTLKGMAIDIERRRPKLANVTGGLSGAAIKPVALRYVYEVKRACRVPVIAMGGILSAEDAIEFLIAGADLVAVGTANFINPRAALDILEGIAAYCQKHKLSRVDDLRGSLAV
jgi:dihydroorotate dehydrogenase (NAD+) catalytic subunit